MDSNADGMLQCRGISGARLRLCLEPAQKKYKGLNKCCFFTCTHFILLQGAYVDTYFPQLFVCKAAERVYIVGHECGKTLLAARWIPPGE